jgi:CRP-like cAMP-binding protein
MTVIPRRYSVQRACTVQRACILRELDKHDQGIKISFDGLQCSVGGAMKSTNVELSTILDRIIDKAADNLRIAKILVQLGLDPDHITYDAIFNRLFEIFLANITIANICALVGAIFFVATLLTRTMVPLRVSNMISNVFFMAFGALAGDIRTFLVFLLLLPINAIRLRQMLNLVKRARNAVRGERSMEWLKPFMTQRKYRQGDVLCRKGDAANEMFLTVNGKFLVAEFGIELPPGSPVGELGFLTPNNQRTATVECTEAAQVLTITYERLLELYFQNPQFGYYFLVLTSQRLLQNIARAESISEQNKMEIARLEGIIEQNKIKQQAGSLSTMP